MNERESSRKQLRLLLILMLVIVIPGVMRLVATDALSNTRTVDVITLFAAGVLTGVTLARTLDYFRLRTAA